MLARRRLRHRAGRESPLVRLRAQGTPRAPQRATRRPTLITIAGVVDTAAFDATLGPTDTVEGRAFTDPGQTWSDAEVMRTMLVRERALARAWVHDRSAGASVIEHDEEGRRHWLAVPDTAALVGARDVTAVGFFGQRREEVDHSILFELEREVVDSFAAYARLGLLSYYDMELEHGRYGNLILFWTPDVPKQWYTNAAHERAIAIAPRHYRSVRLHKSSIRGPLLGGADLTIERTKYLDFDGERIWRGLRLFVGT